MSQTRTMPENREKSERWKVTKLFHSQKTKGKNKESTQHKTFHTRYNKPQSIDKKSNTWTTHNSKTNWIDKLVYSQKRTRQSIWRVERGVEHPKTMDGVLSMRFDMLPSKENLREKENSHPALGQDEGEAEADFAMRKNPTIYHRLEQRVDQYLRKCR